VTITQRRPKDARERQPTGIGNANADERLFTVGQKVRHVSQVLIQAPSAFPCELYNNEAKKNRRVL